MVRYGHINNSPICDSYVRPSALVRICDECNFGNYGNKCIVCGGHGVSVCVWQLTWQDAYYCAECTRLEKDRDGCPKTVNLGHARMDAIFSRKMQGMYVKPYDHANLYRFQRG